MSEIQQFYGENDKPAVDLNHAQDFISNMSREDR